MDRNKITNLILDRLGSEREQIEKQWKHPEGTTTRHFVVENLLPAEIAEAAYEAFPRDGNGFFNRDTFREKKRTSAHLSEYPTILGEITYAIQSPEVIGWCSDVTGVDHLEPDPSLYAGGLSMMFQNDFLNPHIDNSHDAKRDRYRRLNALYYVSPDWTLEKGGNFEMWNDDRSKPVTIISGDNRLVVMELTKRHGTPSARSRPSCQGAASQAISSRRNPRTKPTTSTSRHSTGARKSRSREPSVPPTTHFAMLPPEL